VGGVRYDTAVWDLGGVLVDWDPRYLYRQLLPDAESVETFLAEVSFLDWNEQQDAGRSWAAGVAAHALRHPHRRALLAAYPERFAETLGGDIPESVATLETLGRSGIRQLALTNWSAESFPHARRRFGWIREFEAVIVSGEEGVAKPDPRIFRIVVDRHGVDPARAVFIDDNPRNVAAAGAIGMTALPFSTPARLRADLIGLGLLPAAG